MHASLGYCHIERFSALSKYPECLTQGDIDQNVRDLKALPVPPDEPTAHDMREALQANLLEGLLVQTLALVKDSPQSTVLVEKAHGQAANQLKRHQQFSGDTVAVRNVLVDAKALLARRREDINIERASATVAKLENYRSRLTGRNMFCRKRMRDVAATRADPSTVMEDNAQVVASHTEEYKALPPPTRHEYDDEAKVENVYRELRNEEALVSARARLRILRQRSLQARRPTGVPNTLGALRFSDEEAILLAEVFWFFETLLARMLGMADAGINSLASNIYSEPGFELNLARAPWNQACFKQTTARSMNSIKKPGSGYMLIAKLLIVALATPGALAKTGLIKTNGSRSRVQLAGAVLAKRGGDSCIRRRRLHQRHYRNG